MANIRSMSVRLPKIAGMIIVSMGNTFMSAVVALKVIFIRKK